MKRFSLIAVALVFASVAFAQTQPTAPAQAVAPAPYKASPGPCTVETVTYDWVDGARNREVPVKIYYPKEGNGPFPIIVFSHGLGGSRDGYSYLGKHWASHGYVSVHVTHKGSDTEVWKGVENMEGAKKAMNDSIADLRNAVDRPLDIQFAITQMEKLNEEDSPFKGRLDMEKVGVAGHSFGAWTTLAIAGQGAAALEKTPYKFIDPRVKAAIAMSAPVPPAARKPGVFSTVTIPVFHMTGTNDTSIINDTPAEDRRLPFDRITGADQFLVTFEGGDHMVFSGRPRAMAGGEKDDFFHNFILQSTTAFWDAYLRGDANAKAWLTGGGFEKVLGKDGKFEKKMKQ